MPGLTAEDCPGGKLLYVEAELSLSFMCTCAVPAVAAVPAAMFEAQDQHSIQHASAMGELDIT